jgi:hypothetical protein
MSFLVRLSSTLTTTVFNLRSASRWMKVQGDGFDVVFQPVFTTGNRTTPAAWTFPAAADSSPSNVPTTTLVDGDGYERTSEGWVVVDGRWGWVGRWWWVVQEVGVRVEVGEDDHRWGWVGSGDRVRQRFDDRGRRDVVDPAQATRPLEVSGVGLVQLPATVVLDPVVAAAGGAEVGVGGGSTVGVVDGVVEVCGVRRDAAAGKYTGAVADVQQPP